MRPGPLAKTLSTAAVLLATSSACGLTELGVDEVGEAPQCDGARTWPIEFAELELALADAIADVRDTGTMCGDEEFKGVADLTIVPELRCAARLDATVRAETDDIDQQSAQVTSAFARVNLSGYDGIVRHQLIAADFFSATELFAAWAASPEHCAAMLDKDLAHVGIGHSRTADDARSVFVVLTGEERD
ncbi:MAG: CAP domain-containing protein [Myxococcota bacterium]